MSTTICELAEEQVVLVRNMATVGQGGGPGSTGTSFIPSAGGEW